MIEFQLQDWGHQWAAAVNLKSTPTPKFCRWNISFWEEVKDVTGDDRDVENRVTVNYFKFCPSESTKPINSFNLH